MDKQLNIKEIFILIVKLGRKCQYATVFYELSS